MKQRSDICFVQITSDAGTYWVEASHTILGSAIGRLCESEIGGKALPDGEYFAEIIVERGKNGRAIISRILEIIL